MDRCGRACAIGPAFELDGIIAAAAGGANPALVIGGADDRVGDWVELGARLLEGELHRTSPLHAVGCNKGRGDAGADDQQAVIAQHHNVAVTEIGEEAGAFIGVSPCALIVVVGDIADDLQRMLVERQQPVLLHRHGAACDRVGVEDARHFQPGPMHGAGYRKAGAIDLAFRGLDLVALGIDLDQRRRGELIEQETVGVDQETVVLARHPCGNAGVDQIRPSKQVDETVAGCEVAPCLPFLG
jgi:hypothetical protein